MSTEILLATYNGEKYLPTLLASLEKQTEKDFFVRFQDDGSTDRTQKILAQWMAKDARMIPADRQGMHLGAKGNFCSLISQSRAERILLCDQDDIWEPEKVEKLIETCNEAEQELGVETPILVHSDASLIDEKGCLVAPSFFRRQGWDPRAAELNRLLVQNNVTGCTVIMNRALAKLVSDYGKPETMFMHDWFIAMTAASFGQIRFVNEPLVRYRQHGSNTIGASRTSMMRRGLKFLQEKEKARERIALTYSNAQAFKDSFGQKLPEDARTTIDHYLNIQRMSKIRRIHHLCSDGYLMQNHMTRLGQLFFG